MASMPTETPGRAGNIDIKPNPPLSAQLGALYEDNVAAKIVRTAIQGLVNNVSQIN